MFAKGIDLPPQSIAFYRSFFAGLALLPFVPVSKWVFRPVMLPCVIVFGAMIGMYITAMKYTTAANAIFLQCTATFWLVPLGILLLGEHADRRSLAGIALATLGIAAIVLWGYDPNRPGERLGVILALASGVAYALVVTGLRGLRALDPGWLSIVNNLGGALALGLGLLVLNGSPPAAGTPKQLAILAVFGVVQMAIPYMLFAQGLRVVGAAEAGLISLLEPALNPLWVYLVWNEKPAPATLFGGTLLLAGVALRYAPLTLTRRPTPTPDPT